MQPGDVPVTFAYKRAKDIGFTPVTPITEGIKFFVDWYLNQSFNQ